MKGIDHFTRSGVPGTRLLVVAVALAFAIVTAFSGRASAEDPPLPTNRYVSQFPVSTVPAQYEVVQLVLDFAPGAFTRLHNHGGPTYVTVLEGQITRIESGKESVYGPGQTFTETPGVFHSAGNRGGVKARLMASILLSPGEPVTINQADSEVPAATPTTAFISRTTLGTQPAEFTLTHVVVDFSPGAYIPRHTHGGPGLVTVIDGEIAFTSDTGAVRLRPGGIFLDSDSPHDARNVASGASTAIVTFLVRKGAGITTFVTPPAAAAPSAPTGSAVSLTPPRAGDAGLLGPKQWGAETRIAFVGGGVAAMAGVYCGWALTVRRRRSRSES